MHPPYTVPKPGECHNLLVTEDEVRRSLREGGMTLQPRKDGFYDIFDSDGYQVALLDWCVESDMRNDRGGEVGSAYPLTLDEIESIIT